MIPFFRHDTIYRDFGFSAGITNRALIDGFLKLDMLDVKEGEKLLGEDPVTTLPGDRLLTDADWLDEEFLAAKAKYQGPPKDIIDIRVDRAMGVPEEIIQQEYGPLEDLLKAKPLRKKRGTRRKNEGLVLSNPTVDKE